MPIICNDGEEGLVYVPARLTLTIYQGDTPVIPFHIEVGPEGEEEDLDLTGAVVRAQARSHPENSTKLFSFIVAVLAPATQGRFTLQPAAADSAKLPPASVYDVEIESGGIIRTYVTGSLISPRQVTRL